MKLNFSQKTRYLAHTAVIGLSFHQLLAFEVISGSVSEFTSPDQLLLDPATNLIAVNVVDGGAGDLLVNGVTFLGDGGAEGSGSTTQGDITVVTTRASATAGGGEIATWAVAPGFTGGIGGDSAANLGRVMEGIRWANSTDGGGLEVIVSGLMPDLGYDVQLLFNEGAARDRRFDIDVEGVLAVDDFSTQGGDGTYSAANSFVYRGVLAAGADGELNIRLERDLGGIGFQGGDANPTLNGIIIHEGPTNTAPTDITIDQNEVIATAVTGTPIGVFSSVDANSSIFTYELVDGDGGDDNANFTIVDNELRLAADISGGGAATYSIRVKTTDSQGASFQRNLAVIGLADSDADQLADIWEQSFSDNLNDLNGLASGPGPGAGSGDFDDDGSPDLAEQSNETSPIDSDSDDDGSNDGEEAAAMTDPNNEDTDGDDLLDGAEADNDTDPLDMDSDDDNLNDKVEVDGGTDPNLPDTDGDGVNDDIDPEPNNIDVFSRTVALFGEIQEFKTPEELELDSIFNVIAVNVNGVSDLDVSGVTFFADQTEGSVTNGGVTVMTTAPNEILEWAPAPLFTSADTVSAENLGGVMRSIRWAEDPDPVDIAISGLSPGVTYEVQLLFNEGNIATQRPDRVFDIVVGGELVVDNFTSRGFDGFGVWTADNSFVYSGQFVPSAEGVLDIQLIGDFGGAAQFDDGNSNPIVQAIIVNQTGIDRIVVTDIEADLVNDQVSLSFDSILGATYAVDFVENLDDSDSWNELDDSIQGQAMSTTIFIPVPSGSTKGFFRVRLVR